MKTLSIYSISQSFTDKNKKEQHIITLADGSVVFRTPNQLRRDFNNSHLDYDNKDTFADLDGGTLSGDVAWQNAGDAYSWTDADGNVTDGVRETAGYSIEGFLKLKVSEEARLFNKVATKAAEKLGAMLGGSVNQPAIAAAPVATPQIEDATEAPAIEAEATPVVEPQA